MKNHVWDAFDDIVAVYLARSKEQEDVEYWANLVGVDKGTMDWRIANAKKVESEQIAINAPQSHKTNEDAAKMTIAVVNLMKDLEDISGAKGVHAAFERYIKDVDHYVHDENNR